MKLFPTQIDHKNQVLRQAEIDAQNKISSNKTFLENHGAEVKPWTTGIHHSSKMSDLSDFKRENQSAGNLKPGAQAHTQAEPGAYDSLVEKMKRHSQMRDKHDLNRFEEEIRQSDTLKKWAGTGLEEEVYNEYMDPYTRKSATTMKSQQPLFPKNLKSLQPTPPQQQTQQFINLDGIIEYEATPFSFQGGQQSRDPHAQYKNRLYTQSRFFYLKNQQKTHQVGFLATSSQPTKLGATTLKCYQTTATTLQFVQEQSQTMGGKQFQKNNNVVIPLVKEWFESLDVKDRVICLSTVDDQILKSLKDMELKLQKVSQQHQGKFQMRYADPLANVKGGKPRMQDIMLCNSQAHRSTQEVVEAELKLLSQIRVTDTFQMHDTLTVCDSLVQNPSQFYQLAEEIVGLNFLRAPHEVLWHSSYACFETKAPLWFDMHQPTSLAAWILYYLERALFIQHQVHVHSNFLDCKDFNNQSMIIKTDSKNICIRDELNPFWRGFTENVVSAPQQLDSFLADMRAKSFKEFGIALDNSGQIGVSSLNGGLETGKEPPAKQKIRQVIEQYLQQVKSAALDPNSSPFTSLCQESLIDAATCLEEQKISQELFLQAISRAPIIQTNNNRQESVAEQSIQIRLHRIWVTCFREKITEDLKSNFVSKNKKVQNRKIKKLKERQLKLEQERLQKQQTSNNPSSIQVHKKDAIDLLIGTTDKEHLNPIANTQIAETIQNVVQEKKNKKKKKNQTSDPKDTNTVGVLAPATKTGTPRDANNGGSGNNPNNYFQVFGHKYQEESLKLSNRSSELLAASTAATNKELIKKTKLWQQAQEANSNAEILEIYKEYLPTTEGNNALKKTEWRRDSQANEYDQIVNELMSETVKSSPQKQKSPAKIEVRVSENNKIYAHIPSEVGKGHPSSGSSSSEVTSSKKMIRITKKQVRKVVPRAAPNHESSDSDVTSSDEDMKLLPDVNQTQIQPEDNDSSVYDQDDSAQDDQSSEESSSIAGLSNQHLSQGYGVAKKRMTPGKSVNRRKQQRQRRKQSSVKSANLINFYPPPEVTVDIQPEVIVNKWTQLKHIEPITLTYVVYTKEHQIGWTTVKNKKKISKKERKLAWEMQQQQNQKMPEVQPKQIEIVKAVGIVSQPEPSTIQPAKNNKSGQLPTSKPKVAAAASQSDPADVLNQFIKKMHHQEPIGASGGKEEVKKGGGAGEKQQGKKQVAQVKAPGLNVGVVASGEGQTNKYQPKKNAAVSNVVKKPVLSVPNPEDKKTSETNQKKPASHNPDTLNPTDQNQSTSKPKQPKLASTKPSTVVNNSPPSHKAEPTSEQQPAHPSPSKPKSDLNIASSEFHLKVSEPLLPPVIEEDQVVSEGKPKKKKKNRSSKRKKQQQQASGMLLDPLLSTELLPITAYLASQGNVNVDFINNPQVQDLFAKLNEQVMARQQQQLADLQLKQQEEAEKRLLEDCVPCAQTDKTRYYEFFDKLESEMKSKIKEVDQLKDSVRKERQGFITIMESVVRDTFQNKYGNGYVGIKIFGSMATELAIETSDVDLVVTGIRRDMNSHHGYVSDSKKHMIQMMSKLNQSLIDMNQNSRIIHKIKFISSATVPIIKLTIDLQAVSQKQKVEELAAKAEEEEEEKGCVEEERKVTSEVSAVAQVIEAKQINPRVRFLKVDISIDEESELQTFQKFDHHQYSRTHSGIDTIYHIQQMCKNRQDLRPIVMIIKKIFDETFLSMPYYGGISSYSLVLMVSAYLKRFDPEKQTSLSINLMNFLHFYGVGFKPEKFYLNGDEILFCSDPQKRPCTDPFIVLDPLDSANNISHSTYRFRDIQKSLIKAFKIINKSCEFYQLASGIPKSASEPKLVLERLLSEIKDEYLQPHGYEDFE